MQPLEQSRDYRMPGRVVELLEGNLAHGPAWSWLLTILPAPHDHTPLSSPNPATLALDEVFYFSCGSSCRPSEDESASD